MFLVGPMGAGKTTIGSQLARNLGFEFLDLDQELERRTGASVALIFDVEGEPGFRERESKLLDELTQRDGLVLATGGGAVLAQENRQRLSERGLVVYLRTPLDVLVQRTRFDTTRPLLRNADPAATLGNILEVREPLYQEVADLVVDTGKLSVKQVVRKVTGKLK